VRLPDPIVRRLQTATYEEIRGLWMAVLDELGEHHGSRALCLADRFFLLTVALNRPDADHPWLYARCREIEAAPDGHLDLWAREHYKSTIITFSGSIQEILRDPEITIGIFSHTKPIAEKFLIQIKSELERNGELQTLFPDVLYTNPEKEAPKWSEQKGIVVKRAGNPKENTIEAWGLVDAQPTGAHFRLRIYDDVVTKDSVGTPEQVLKTTLAWELSDNLGARGPDGAKRSWHLGTRYSFGDTYGVMLERKSLVPRVYPATHDGTLHGRLVFLSKKAWEDILSKQSMVTIAAQQLLNPAAAGGAMFSKDHLKFTDIRPGTLNIYILIDPASTKKKGSDSTAMAVVALDAAGNKFLVDGYCHKMKLSERWMRMRDLREKWMRQPGIQRVEVGYERYGSASDMDYFQEQMEKPGAEIFDIAELNWVRETGQSKYDRIQRLEPDFRNGRFYLIGSWEGETRNQARMRAEGQPWRILKPVKQRDQDGMPYALNAIFLNQFLTYPFVAHDDLLDATSRIYDMDPKPPVIVDPKSLEPAVFEDS
jgi:hypothetical protein